MRGVGGSRRWIIWIVIIALIAIGIWYYTNGDLSVITDKIKGLMPASGE